MSGTEDETSDTEPVTHPDYEYVQERKRYRHKPSGQFAKTTDVVAAAEALTAAAAAKAKAEADKMSENYHKIRLPTWNPAKPQLWFKECEDLFTPSNGQAQQAQTGNSQTEATVARPKSNKSGTRPTSISLKKNSQNS